MFIRGLYGFKRTRRSPADKSDDCLGLMHEARCGRHLAAVQTAAASAVGRMIVKLGKTTFTTHH